ncbi:MAG: methylated-DNA--[protein]-cysteine S-methyltransferase [Nitratireductor sp.]|nr:methylated-DNA--[protein]-cysteine S-methyltransferase [Nitratireductor sp.]
MTNTFLTLFDTALGRCGIAWGDNGILSASFAEDSDDRTRAHLRRRAKDAVETDAVPAEIATVIADIRALMAGASKDLMQARLDLRDLGAFETELYALTRAIGPGETRTYGDLARALGDVALSQRVGQSLGRNPFPIIVPCHRVVGAGGAMTGFSAPGGIETKRQLLKIEGAIGPDLIDLMV